MVNWPKGCGEPLSGEQGWTEWYSYGQLEGTLYKEHFWTISSVLDNDFQPEQICGATRGPRSGDIYWRYYCSRCARRTGVLW